MPSPKLFPTLKAALAAFAPDAERNMAEAPSKLLNLLKSLGETPLPPHELQSKIRAGSIAQTERNALPVDMLLALGKDEPTINPAELLQMVQERAGTGLPAFGVHPRDEWADTQMPGFLNPGDLGGPEGYSLNDYTVLPPIGEKQLPPDPFVTSLRQRARPVYTPEEIAQQLTDEGISGFPIAPMTAQRFVDTARSPDHLTDLHSGLVNGDQVEQVMNRQKWIIEALHPDTNEPFMSLLRREHDPASPRGIMRQTMNPYYASEDLPDAFDYRGAGSSATLQPRDALFNPQEQGFYGLDAQVADLHPHVPLMSDERPGRFLMNEDVQQSPVTSEGRTEYFANPEGLSEPLSSPGHGSPLGTVGFSRSAPYTEGNENISVVTALQGDAAAKNEQARVKFKKDTSPEMLQREMDMHKRNIADAEAMIEMLTKKAEEQKQIMHNFHAYSEERNDNFPSGHGRQQWLLARDRLEGFEDDIKSYTQTRDAFKRTLEKAQRKKTPSSMPKPKYQPFEGHDWVRFVVGREVNRALKEGKDGIFIPTAEAVSEYEHVAGTKPAVIYREARQTLQRLVKEFGGELVQKEIGRKAGDTALGRIESFTTKGIEGFYWRFPKGDLERNAIKAGDIPYFPAIAGAALTGAEAYNDQSPQGVM